MLAGNPMNSLMETPSMIGVPVTLFGEAMVVTDMGLLDYQNYLYNIVCSDKVVRRRPMPWDYSSSR